MKTNFKMTQTGISNQALVTRSRSTVNSATRDLELLSNEGITSEYLTTWSGKIDLFENETNYKEQQIALKKLRMFRDQEASGVKLESMKSLEKLKVIYPKGSSEYDSILFTQVGKLEANGIKLLAANILNILKNGNPMYAILGITPERIAEFETSIQNLQTAIEAYVHAKRSFSILTNQRQQLRSEVYFYYQYVCTVAKLIWRTKNSAYYKDYLMYETQSPPKTEASPSEAAAEAETQSSAN